MMSRWPNKAPKHQVLACFPLHGPAASVPMADLQSFLRRTAVSNNTAVDPSVNLCNAIGWWDVFSMTVAVGLIARFKHDISERRANATVDAPSLFPTYVPKYAVTVQSPNDTVH
jgi:hypothetical protein